MALVNDQEAAPVRTLLERGRLALGAALSLALHAGGLAVALGVSLRAEEPEELVVEVVWEAPAPAEATPMEVAAAEPAPLQPESVPVAAAEAETAPEPPAEPEPARQAEPAPAPLPLAEAPPESPPLPPRPAPKPQRRIEAPASAAPAPVAQPVAPPAAASPAPVLVAPAATTQQDDYVRVLLRWLEPHRRYPRSARLRGVEGVVRIALLIDRAGSVVETRVAESSGEPSLDAAALEMVARAAPAPPLPAHWSAQRAAFVVPIRFALSG